MPIKIPDRLPAREVLAREGVDLIGDRFRGPAGRSGCRRSGCRRAGCRDGGLRRAGRRVGAVRGEVARHDFGARLDTQCGAEARARVEESDVLVLGA